LIRVPALIVAHHRRLGITKPGDTRVKKGSATLEMFQVLKVGSVPGSPADSIKNTNRANFPSGYAGVY